MTGSTELIPFHNVSRNDGVRERERREGKTLREGERGREGGWEGGKAGCCNSRIALPEDCNPYHPHQAGKPGKPQQVVVFQPYLKTAHGDEDRKVGLSRKVRGRCAESVVIPVQIAWRRREGRRTGSELGISRHPKE